MNPSLVVVGSLNLDLVATVRRAPGPGETVLGKSFQTFCGGKGANQAFAAGKLGASVTMIGRVGVDAAAELQLANLASAGVDIRWVHRDPASPSGTAMIVVDENHENRIVIIPGANGTFEPAALERTSNVLTGASFVLLQLEIPLETVTAAIAMAKAGGASILLDPAPAQPLPDELLASVDYLTPNLSELSLLSGITLTETSSDDAIIGAARVLITRGAPKVIAKAAERGAWLVALRDVQHVAAFPVRAMDPTAAGDCFNAAFAIAMMEGKSEADALRFAAAAAAICVTRPGAQASMPSREEVEDLLQVQAFP